MDSPFFDICSTPEVGATPETCGEEDRNDDVGLHNITDPVLGIRYLYRRGNVVRST